MYVYIYIYIYIDGSKNSGMLWHILLNLCTNMASEVETKMGDKGMVGKEVRRRRRRKGMRKNLEPEQSQGLACH